MDSCWNLWHGCHRISEGCKNCYVYRRDDSIGKDASAVYKTAAFDLPIRRNRDGSYKLPSGRAVFASMTSDFFLKESDDWRPEAWKMMRQRSDIPFFIITKRILRMGDCLPPDWGNGYPNVTVVSTVENQRRADERLPELLRLPIAHKQITCEPLLEEIDLFRYLDPSIIEGVSAGGESGELARVCDYRWVLSIAEQCRIAGVPFSYHQTGAKLLKDGKLYRIPRRLQHAQAKKAGLDSACSIRRPDENY